MTALQYSEYYLVTTIYLGFSGVTRQNIKMQKTSEIQPISEVFRYHTPTFLRKILKPRGGRKGYTIDRGADCPSPDMRVAWAIRKNSAISSTPPHPPAIGSATVSSVSTSQSRFLTPIQKGFRSASTATTRRWQTMTRSCSAWPSRHASRPIASSTSRNSTCCVFQETCHY